MNVGRVAVKKIFVKHDDLQSERSGKHAQQNGAGNDGVDVGMIVTGVVIDDQQPGQGFETIQNQKNVVRIVF
jgi:hypothetical protein